MTTVSTLATEKLTDILNSEDKEFAALVIFLFDCAQHPRDLVKLSRTIHQDNESEAYDDINAAIEEALVDE
jgi:hypothetical protein